MKFFLQVFTLLLFSFSFIFADNFEEINKIILKKDEQKKILVKYDDKEKLFTFRWTLYKNGGLVIFRSYDTIVAQNILYLRRNNRSFKLELQPRGTDYRNLPYLLVRFKDFDNDTREAEFELMLSDKKKQIELKNLKND